MASAPRTNLASRRLGKYQLIARIGAGGMAEVFLARQFGVKGFNKLVVIKAIHEHLIRDPKFSDLLVEEARLAAQINHPNVVDIYEVGFEKGIYFIAMEYVRGHSLVQVVRKGRQHRKLDVYSVTKVIAEAARGLDAAHNHRSLTGEALEFVHRDVTLGNIIVSYEGAVKLVDFGVSKAKGRLLDVEGKVVAGKLGYAAPEQLRGETVDRRADIFGLGVTLWETLTHRRLLKAKSRSEALEAFKSWAPPPPSQFRPETPGELDEVCLRALAARPEDRYPSAAAMRRELTEMLRLANYHADSNALADYMEGVFADERRQLTERVFKALKNDGAEPGGARPALRVVAGRSLLAERVETEEPDTDIDDDPTDIIDVSEIIAGNPRGVEDSEDIITGDNDTIADLSPRVDPEVDAMIETSMANILPTSIRTRRPTIPPIERQPTERLSSVSGEIRAPTVPLDDTERLSQRRAPKVMSTDAEPSRRMSVQKALWAACLTLAALLIAIVALVVVRGDPTRQAPASAAQPATAPTEPPQTTFARLEPAATPDPEPDEPDVVEPDTAEPDVAEPAVDDADETETPEKIDEPEEIDEPEPEPEEIDEPEPEPEVRKPAPKPKPVAPAEPKRDRAKAKQLYQEGIRLSASGSTGAAKRRFREALQADPGLAGAHRALGLMYERQGSKGRAIREYRRYLRKAPRARDAGAIKKRIERLR